VSPPAIQYGGRHVPPCGLAGGSSRLRDWLEVVGPMHGSVLLFISFSVRKGDACGRGAVDVVSMHMGRDGAVELIW